MRFDAKLQLLVILAISPFFLAACNNTQTQNVQPVTSYSIGGTVVNLAANGGGLVLQDNGGDNLIVNANGSFKFPTALAGGSSYKVTVFGQPSNPAQTCGVMSGAGTAMAEVTDVRVDCGHNEWSWLTGAQTVNQIGSYGTLGVPAAGNTPGGRQFPATWTDVSGNLWLFGGYGYDSAGTFLPFNDLWKFSGGQWTWMGGPSQAGQNGNYGTLGVSAASNIPGARTEASSWTDTSGNFWLFGGIGFDSVGNESPMNDLWKYSGGQWTWMAGSSVGLQHGTYGTLGVADEENAPGGRNSAVTWMDASGSIWVFGGIGYDESDPINGELNDLWKYSDGEWTWMGGPKIKQQPGVYGTQGMAAASNIPGARLGAFGWADANGNFWLFGGFGYDSLGQISNLNDQWKYRDGQWTWVTGSNVVNQLGVYGTQGIAAANNIPGARQNGVTWTDSSANAWIFGGNGIYTPVAAGQLNDLWKFSDGEWTWMGGSQVGNQNSTYGTQGSLAPGNTPGGRVFPTRWVDAKGNLWLFGGYGESAGAQGNLNDLWMYMP
jgi:N-acetylneuraminic acid mutarotase